MTKNDISLTTLAEIDKLIHEPARLMILSVLYISERADALFIKTQTDLSWGNLSSHMTKLEGAGYLKVDKDFIDRKPRTMLSLTEKGRVAFDLYRTQMTQILAVLGE